jgi:hypothetical protein
MRDEDAEGADIRNAVSMVYGWLWLCVKVPDRIGTGSRTRDREESGLICKERVVKDSEQMIPRTKKSLDEAVVVLEDLVVSCLAHGSERAGADLPGWTLLGRDNHSDARIQGRGGAIEGGQGGWDAEWGLSITECLFRILGLYVYKNG